MCDSTLVLYEFNVKNLGFSKVDLLAFTLKALNVKL